MFWFHLGKGSKPNYTRVPRRNEPEPASADHPTFADPTAHTTDQPPAFATALSIGNVLASYS